MSKYWCELAVVGDPAAGEVAESVLVEVDGQLIVSVMPSTPLPADAVVLKGVTLPGLSNVHSHAFHRVLRARAERQSSGGDFWTWRDEMYEVASVLDPKSYFDLARALFTEMALSGISGVGEFHYLHHGPGGVPYSDPNEMGRVLLAAADSAGIRITLVDACYLEGGFGRGLEGPQLRFGDADAEAWAARVEELYAGLGSLAAVGAAVHSVRAVPLAAIEVVADAARSLGAVLHAHLSEQSAENEGCRKLYGISPTELLFSCGALGPASTVVHATHLEAEDIGLLGSSATSACICPTTERELGDGIGPAAALLAAGSPLCAGSDSQAVVDLFEEARGIELDERLATMRRGVFAPGTMLASVTSAGHRAIGWPGAGRIEAGALADFATVGLDSPRLAGTRPEHVVAALVFVACASDVTDLVVGGRQVVAEGRHLLVDEPGRAMAEALARIDRAMGLS